MSYDKLSVLGKKRERELQINESRKYNEFLRSKLNGLNEAERFVDSLYTNIYHNSTKLNVLLELTYGELPMKDVNKLTIRSFINIDPSKACITSYKQCYDFYCNTVALFLHYNTNSSDDELLTQHNCALISEQGKYYVLLSKYFESHLKYSLNFSVFVNKCDYMLIEITDVDVLIWLSDGNDALKDLDAINSNFISTYQDMKRNLCALEEQVRSLNYAKSISEYDKHQQIHNLNVKLHEAELQNRIMIDNERERSSKHKSYLVSTFSFEIAGEPKIVQQDSNFEPLRFTNIYEEVVGKEENEKYLCTICFENERNVFFPKCGHCVVCFECVGGLQKEGSKYSCPSCRKFSNIQKIIFS